MAVVGTIVGLIGAGVGVVVGMVGGLLGLVFGLLGGAVRLLPFLFPVALIVIGIIWLVKKSNPTPVAEARDGHYGPAPPPGPGTPR